MQAPQLRKDALSKDFLVIHFLLTQKTPRTCVARTQLSCALCDSETKLLRLG